MEIVTIETASLGDRSYVVHDGEVALVVDPQRDLDRVLEVVAEHGVRVDAVVETHIHNDYVTGGFALARRTGARYLVAAADDVAFDRIGLRDGDRFRVGALTVSVLATPGHTPTHLAYVVGRDGTDRAVFSGGSLLYGSVGRTDLIGDDVTEELTRSQYRSARRLADRLADDVALYPTHGFGSFCSSGETTGATTSTIGDEREVNQALRIDDEDAFVTELLGGLDAFPAYYAHMAPANRDGPDAADLEPPTAVDAAEVRRRIHAGEWVVDLRSRRAYADAHLVGTIGMELDTTMSTYLGWLIPWGTPVTLIGASAADVAAAQRQLVRIGIDRPAGQASADVVDAGPTASYPVASFADLADAREAGQPLTILDARRRDERGDGRIDGSVHVPLHELLDRLGELPEGPLWVHCATGYRASIAASLLDRAGHDVVLVDDDVDEAAEHLAWT